MKMNETIAGTIRSQETLDSVVEDDDDVDIDMDDDSVASKDSSTAHASLAKKETKVVSMFRVILVILLVATALAISIMAYFLSRGAEGKTFEEAIEGHARMIIETFESEASEKRTAIVTLSQQLTSQALFTNSTWPFVTLPDWEIRARSALELADVLGLFVLPLVREQNLQEWANYSVANQGWFAEGLAMQEQEKIANRAPASTIQELDLSLLTTNGTIGKMNMENRTDWVPSYEFSFPVWQFTPQIKTPFSFINFDFLSFPDSKPELDSFLQNDAPGNMVGPASVFEPGSGGANFVGLLLEHWRARQNANSQYEGGPVSYYYIPIYERFEPDAPVVGVIMSWVFWQTYFERLLPETAVGIEVVLDNTCGQLYTFGIRGRKATFLGDGDLHDTKYDNLAHETDYGVFLQRDAQRADGGCLYKLRVYPSQEMEDDYMTNKPLITGLSIFGVFMFTTLTFLLYDRFVERRQRLVMKSAKESGSVVSKLFPEEVRDRLFQNEAKDPKHSLKDTFLVASGRSNRADSSASQHGASPIADEYPNCTVFFADLAGFTKWSSARTPSEVFLLLETIYGAFDKIAKKLGVFKIETIGDCYVAVTGLPKPQDDHAVIMSKFAAACVFKFNQLVNSESILSTLGDATATLQMRVGMHSGPVTAGVLRGEKARFQLFGDTVNTAARMESNGQKGKIQVSQDTADLLMAAGKNKWLTAREDLVAAKGKGQMQTYWVDVTSDFSMKSSVTSGRSNNSGDGLPQHVFRNQVEV